MLLGRSIPDSTVVSHNGPALGRVLCNEGSKSLVSFKRAQSCPNPLEIISHSPSSSKVNVASVPGLGYTKNRGRFCERIKPKLREHFSVGKVLSWTDFASTRNNQGNSVPTRGFPTPNFNLERFNSLGKRTFSGYGGGTQVSSKIRPPGEKKEWKVYSRRTPATVRISGNGTKEVGSTSYAVYDKSIRARGYSSGSSDSLSDSSSDFFGFARVLHRGDKGSNGNERQYSEEKLLWVIFVNVYTEDFSSSSLVIDYSSMKGFFSYKKKKKKKKKVICKIDPDLVVLQEIKRKMIDHAFLVSIWRSRFKEWVVLAAIGRSGGILVIWDVRSLKIKDALVGGFSVSVLVEDECEGDWWFSGVYGPTKRKFRNDFWDELSSLKKICNGRWYAGGDFNVMRRVSEKFNSNTNTRSMKEFDCLIGELELVDQNLKNAKFTWSNFRHLSICCRLDRFLFTNEWATGYPCFG